MTHERSTFGLGCMIAALATSAPAVAAQDLKPDPEGFIVAQPADLVPPDGGRRITILGDPSQPGPYVIRLTWEPGQGSRPHYHDQARFITVLEGTWYVATGAHSDVYDPSSMTAVPAGSFIYEPPNGHHYDMAKDERVVVQIAGIGPVGSTQIPQAEDGSPARQ
jgi:quercetin dioxygenase-like cupin family protein